MRSHFILLYALLVQLDLDPYERLRHSLFSKQKYFSSPTASPTIQLLSWHEAYDKANLLVEKMTLEQKVNITTGVGWMAGPCIGNTGSTPDFPGICLQDSPLGVRLVDGVSSGVSGMNAAASFDKQAIRRRGEYMGKEFRAKGIHAQLGPAMNMLRVPAAGRNWEAFGEDPYLVGVASAETIKGIQSQGVVNYINDTISN
jgi:beta-glucosidase